MSGERGGRGKYDRALLVLDGALLAVITGITWYWIYTLEFLGIPKGYRLTIGETFSKLIATPFNIFSLTWWYYGIELFFNILILVVLAVGTYLVIMWFARAAPHFRVWKRVSGEPFYTKLSPWQRAQHWLLFATFVVCALTGFLTYYANYPYWNSVYWAFGGGGLEKPALLLIHVASGVVMGLLVTVHFGYYGTKALIEKFKYGKRIFDPANTIATAFNIPYFVKLLAYTMVWLVKPVERFDPRKLTGKYTFVDYFDYFGVYWGILVLGIPGAIMAVYGNILGGIPFIMHTEEAVLAVSYLAVVHIGIKHLKPDIFPVDSTIINGKIPLSRISGEHRVWYHALAPKEEGQSRAQP